MTRLLILGSDGLVGQNAISFFSKNKKFDVLGSSKSEVDLRNQVLVNKYFEKVKPDIVLLSAANVGGIKLNMENPTQLLIDNIQIATNVIQASHSNNVSKLINFGSSCMYPVDSNQPMSTDVLLTGPTEKTSESYATYKLASWKMVEAMRTQFGKKWITIIPATIFGPNDNFSLSKGHVISSLIRKFHEAKSNFETEITLWGDGTPLREFIFVDDLLCSLEMIIDSNINENIFNVGSEIEVSISQLAKEIAVVVGFEGKILWDKSKPNGSHRKLLDSSYIKNLGWNPKVSLLEGLEKTYSWFIDPMSKVRH
jgi:GDP-L-fucose synthase